VLVGGNERRFMLLLMFFFFWFVFSPLAGFLHVVFFLFSFHRCGFPRVMINRAGGLYKSKVHVSVLFLQLTQQKESIAID